MKPSVVLFTRDAYLARKIALELGEEAVLTVKTEADAEKEEEKPSLLLWNFDENSREIPHGAVVLTENGGSEVPEDRRLSLPLRIGAIRGLLQNGKEKKAQRLILDTERRSALLDGNTVVFSESEFALLALLCRAGGKAVSREEIAKEVFPGGNSQSLINVYIHYLREKLERGGEKIIHAERGSGYRIDPRFLSAGEEKQKEEKQWQTD